MLEQLCIENAELRDALEAARAEIEELTELRDAGEEMEETLSAALDEATGRVAQLESELLDTTDALEAARAAVGGEQTRVVVKTVEVASPLKPVDLPPRTAAAPAVEPTPAPSPVVPAGPSAQDWELTVSELEEQRRTVKEAEFKVSALEAKLVAAREVERRLHDQVAANRAELDAATDQLAKVTGAAAAASAEGASGPAGGVSYDELRRMVVAARAPRRIAPLGPHRVPLLPDLPDTPHHKPSPLLAISAQLLDYTRRW
jgi:septal ring factor EnvC (AmiA/AmiB activator)